MDVDADDDIYAGMANNDPGLTSDRPDDDQSIDFRVCPHLASGGGQAIRKRALIALMLDAGVRRSEAAGGSSSRMSIALIS